MANRHRLGWPNRITLARLLLVWPFALCLIYLAVPGMGWLRYATIVLLGLMVLSDFLDGYLARRLNQGTALGRFLDPLADKLVITISVLALCRIGVADQPPLPQFVAVAAIGKDLILTIGFGVIYVSTGRPFVQPRIPGKVCTAVQMFMILAVLVRPDLPVWFYGAPRLLWLLATALAVAAVCDYVWIGTRHLSATMSDRGGND